MVGTQFSRTLKYPAGILLKQPGTADCASPGKTSMPSPSGPSPKVAQSNILHCLLSKYFLDHTIFSAEPLLGYFSNSLSAFLYSFYSRHLHPRIACSHLAQATGHRLSIARWLGHALFPPHTALICNMLSTFKVSSCLHHLHPQNPPQCVPLLGSLRLNKLLAHWLSFGFSFCSQFL